MEHSPCSRWHFAAENIENIAVRFTVMNNYRQIKLYGKVNLLQKAFFLYFFRLVFFPVIIKPYFAYCRNFWMHSPRCQFIKIMLIFNTGKFFRVPPHSGINKIILFCKLYGKSGACFVTAGVNKTFHFFADFGNQLVTVIGKIIGIKMGVRIPQTCTRHFISPCCRWQCPVRLPVPGCLHRRWLPVPCRGFQYRAAWPV